MRDGKEDILNDLIHSSERNFRQRLDCRLPEVDFRPPCYLSECLERIYSRRSNDQVLRQPSAFGYRIRLPHGKPESITYLVSERVSIVRSSEHDHMGTESHKT
jgi:hypothetical protein